MKCHIDSSVAGLESNQPKWSRKREGFGVCSAGDIISEPMAPIQREATEVTNGSKHLLKKYLYTKCVTSSDWEDKN